MSRIRRMGTETTNWQTRLNYSPRLKGAISFATFLAPAIFCHYFERGHSVELLPNFTRGRLSDTFSFGAELGFIKTLAGKDITTTDLLALTGFVQIANEFTQAIPGAEKTVFGGTFDWGDITAVFVGAGLWGVYEMAAKFLHDSGATLMAYHALGITHRRSG